MWYEIVEGVLGATVYHGVRSLFTSKKKYHILTTSIIIYYMQSNALSFYANVYTDK